MASSKKESTSIFQQAYETLVFEEIRTSNITATPSLKADIQRRIAAQLYYAAFPEKTDEDPEVSWTLYNNHIRNYYQIVDEQESSKGLDNYSKGALALSSSFKNESKHWSLKELRCSSLFQTLENDFAKRDGTINNNLDFEKTLDFITQSVQTKTEDEKVANASYQVTRLKSSEIELKANPVMKSQQVVNPMIKLPSISERFGTDKLTKANSALTPQFKFATPNERKSENSSHPIERKSQFSTHQFQSENKPDEIQKNTSFRTAKDQLIVDQKKKNSGSNNSSSNVPVCAGRQKSLGPRRGLNSPFILPIKDAKPSENENNGVENKTAGNNNEQEKCVDERLKNIEPRMVELIENEIMDNGAPVNWDDIAGLEFAKTTIKEIVVWPMLRPDIFTGLRGPPRGILLFGPPGTGKTLIGKCIASQSRSTFFSISASSLTSKWVGEGEKMVRALFAVARVNQPSVIFIDEIDSLLSQRSDSEHESSRRIKTEFLVQLDGATTSQEDRLLVVGATNRPQELDEAARRRLVKRLYIPLPEFAARKQIIDLLMTEQRHVIEEEQINDICHRTDGYSCADMTNLCKEAAFGPIRSIALGDIEHITPDQVRPITNEDFDAALCQVRASVSRQDLALYEDWNSRYGSAAK